MKLLIFTDSHGWDDTLRRALDIHHETADYALHAGDGSSSFILMNASYPDVAFRAVRGNCDGWGFYGESAELPNEEIINADGIKILLLHGHRQSVKASPYGLVPYARRLGCDIVVFGHTHEPYEKYIPPENGLPAVRLFNPGAAKDGCYGIIEIRKNGIHLNSASIYGK